MKLLFTAGSREFATSFQESQVTLFPGKVLYFLSPARLLVNPSG